MLLLAPLGLLLSALFIYPMLDMGRTSLGPSGWSLASYGRFFGQAQYVDALLRSLRLGLVVTFLSLLIGYPTAYCLVRARGDRAVSLLLLATFPLWISAIIRAFAWQIILGRGGALGRLMHHLGLTEEPFQLLYTFTGVAIGLMQLMLPVTILGLYAVIRRVPADLEQAAQSLGATPFRAALLVTLPLSARGIASCGVLTYALSLATFATPSIVGGPRTHLMTTIIYEQAMDLLDWRFAATVSCLLLTLGLLAAGLNIGLGRVGIARR